MSGKAVFVWKLRSYLRIFEQLKKHPVPLEEAAIKALSNNAPALDAYLWLVYRLHALKGDKL